MFTYKRAQSADQKQLHVLQNTIMVPFSAVVRVYTTAGLAYSVLGHLMSRGVHLML